MQPVYHLKLLSISDLFRLAFQRFVGIVATRVDDQNPADACVNLIKVPEDPSIPVSTRTAAMPMKRRGMLRKECLEALNSADCVNPEVAKPPRSPGALCSGCQSDP